MISNEGRWSFAESRSQARRSLGLCIRVGAPFRESSWAATLEALRLRVKDIDFGANEITVCDSKGQNIG